MILKFFRTFLHLKISNWNISNKYILFKYWLELTIAKTNEELRNTIVFTTHSHHFIWNSNMPMHMVLCFFFFLTIKSCLWKARIIMKFVESVYLIRRLRRLCDGSTSPRLEPWCGRPLGIEFSPVTCDLYIADAYFGLPKVGPNWSSTATCFFR